LGKEGKADGGKKKFISAQRTGWKVAGTWDGNQQRPDMGGKNRTGSTEEKLVKKDERGEK